MCQVSKHERATSHCCRKCRNLFRKLGLQQYTCNIKNEPKRKATDTFLRMSPKWCCELNSNTYHFLLPAILDNALTLNVRICQLLEHERVLSHCRKTLWMIPKTVYVPGHIFLSMRSLCIIHTRRTFKLFWCGAKSYLLLDLSSFRNNDTPDLDWDNIFAGDPGWFNQESRTRAWCESRERDCVWWNCTRYHKWALERHDRDYLPLLCSTLLNMRASTGYPKKQAS